MAYTTNHVLAAFFIVLGLLFSSSSSSANAHNVVTLNVTGELCCTANLFCRAGAAPLSGAPVGLNCRDIRPGITRTVAQTATAANGTYSIIVPSFDGLLLGTPGQSRPVIPCEVSVPLPLAATTNCSLLSNNSTAGGTLTAPLIAVGDLIHTRSMGLVQKAVAAGSFFLRTF